VIWEERGNLRGDCAGGFGPGWVRTLSRKPKKGG